MFLLINKEQKQYSVGRYILTKSFFRINAPAVASNWVKHIQLKIPAILRREPKKKTRGSSEISSDGDQSCWPNSG